MVKTNEEQGLQFSCGHHCFIENSNICKTHRTQQGLKVYERCGTLENIYRNFSYQNLFKNKYKFNLSLIFLKDMYANSLSAVLCCQKCFSVHSPAISYSSILKSSFFCDRLVDVRPNRRNKATLSNFSSVQ